MGELCNECGLATCICESKHSVDVAYLARRRHEKEVQASRNRRREHDNQILDAVRAAEDIGALSWMARMAQDIVKAESDGSWNEVFIDTETADWKHRAAAIQALHDAVLNADG